MTSKVQNNGNTPTCGRSYVQLFQSHATALRGKHIWHGQQLHQVCELDLEKLTCGLLELQENDSGMLMQRFFADADITGGSLSARIKEQDISHIGFEVYEPLDLVLSRIEHWIEQCRQTLGVSISIRGTLRTPSSLAFQQRVGGFTEILRLWLQVNNCTVKERTVMLELFDIQRPFRSSGCEEDGWPASQRDLQGGMQGQMTLPTHRQRLARFMAADDIWHYGLLVKESADVLTLHREFQALAARNPTYQLLYQEPVHNSYDGSLHTKIVRRANAHQERIELEFIHYSTAILFKNELMAGTHCTDDNSGSKRFHALHSANRISNQL